MDSFFKLRCATEEIVCLNVEIRHLATFMHNETAFLQLKEAEVRLTNPALAYQISTYHTVAGRYQKHHTAILNKIAQLDGYTRGGLFGICLPETPIAVECPTMPPPFVLSHAAMETDDIDDELE